MKKVVGIVGARGHTGVELIALLARHPSIELGFVSSRELEGQLLGDHVAAYVGDMRFTAMQPADLANQRVDAIVLAMPNGQAASWVDVIDRTQPDVAIVDLSADYRFDPTWHYGLPELTRSKFQRQSRISNPGCYATAMQLAIAPLARQLAAPPACFGVSGYSGAGTTPSDKNNPEKLRDNLMPYSLVGHVHEREASSQLGMPVEFMPHVAAYFRGITMTVNLWLHKAVTREAVMEMYRAFYRDEALLRIVDEAPWVSRVAGQHHVEIGGFALAPGGKRLVLVSCLDNLLKGAATQALQNLNTVLGFAEMTAVPLQLPADA